MPLLRQPRPEDRDMVLGWRNSAEVASFMYRDDPISPEEHAGWFPLTLVDTSSSQFRVFEVNSVPHGWIGLTNFDSRHRSCEWGGYLAPDAPRGTGLGRAMLSLSLDLAFQNSDVNRVVVEVLSFNAQALRLYESLGFVREALFREYAHLSSGVFDVIGLSMLKKEWELQRSE